MSVIAVAWQRTQNLGIITSTVVISVRVCCPNANAMDAENAHVSSPDTPIIVTMASQPTISNHESTGNEAPAIIMTTMISVRGMPVCSAELLR